MGRGIRKRVLRWSIYGLPLVFVVAFYVWYAHSFPLPQWKIKSEIVNRYAIKPMESIQGRLKAWKVSNLTNDLSLNGTSWHEPKSGSIIRFGDDGTFHWDVEIDELVRQHVPIECYFLKQSNFRLGSNSVIRWHEDRGGYEVVEPNLHFDSELVQCVGWLAYDGQELSIMLYFPREYTCMSTGCDLVLQKR